MPAISYRGEDLPESAIRKLVPFAEKAKSKKGLFLTGEGSSRIFPAKRAMYDN